MTQSRQPARGFVARVGGGSLERRAASAMPDPLLAAVRTVPDFPTPGVAFRDLAPLLADPALARDVVERLAAPFLTAGVTTVAGLDARGFWFGPSLALRLGAGFVAMRKAGKLPRPVDGEAYALEYGAATLELAAGALGPGDRVLVHDDVLATGGTAAAAVALARRAGAEVLAVTVVLELGALGGRARLPGVRVEAALAD